MFLISKYLLLQKKKKKTNQKNTADEPCVQRQMAVQDPQRSLS